MIKEGYVCNYLTVVQKLKDKGKYKYLCQCKCGNTKIVADNVIRYNNIQDCGCNTYSLDIAKQNYIGKSFNNLTILDCFIEKYQNSNRIFAKCLCNCGNIKSFNLTEVKNGHIKSCGCSRNFNFDRDYKGKVFHNIKILDMINKQECKTDKIIVKCLCHCGELFDARLINLIKKTRYIIACPKCNHKKTPKYNIRKTDELKNGDVKKIFYAMKKRCYNTNSPDFKWYGAKGIKICDEWLNDINKFVEWALNNGYRKGLSIDRIDNSKGYCPQNCHWVNMEYQNNNKPTVTKYNYDGELLSAPQIARRIGISYSTLKARLYRGMDFETAIHIPIKNGKI